MASLSPHSKGLVSSEALKGCINLAESIYQNQISLSTLRLPGLKAVACSGLTLHFDRLSVLSLPKEATLLYPAFKGGAWRRRMGQRPPPSLSTLCMNVPIYIVWLDNFLDCWPSMPSDERI